jgi:hypothetical protein
MRATLRFHATCAAVALLGCQAAEADISGAVATTHVLEIPVAKAASAQTLGARGTVTSSATQFGGFEITTATNVLILVRGNSLGTLGITQGYLHVPRVRVFNAAGQDLFNSAGTGLPGFSGCPANNSTAVPVRNYYASRGAVSDLDGCVAANFQPGAYTFTVTPSSLSIPTSGEILFEVKLNP